MKNPKDPEPLYEIVKSYLKRGHEKEAFEYLKLTHQMHPKPKAYYQYSSDFSKWASALEYVY